MVPVAVPMTPTPTPAQRRCANSQGKESTRKKPAMLAVYSTIPAKRIARQPKNDSRLPVTKRPARQPMTIMPALKPAVLRLAR